MAKEFKDILNEARKDNIESKIIVADKYESDKKYKEAFRWYLEAASDGKVEAQLKVADYYFDGVYVKKDCLQACYWYGRAADLGNTKAMVKLANLYKDGFVLERDFNKAFDLNFKAAVLGNVEAKYNLGVMYRNALAHQYSDDKRLYLREEKHFVDINQKLFDEIRESIAKYIEMFEDLDQNNTDMFAAKMTEEMQERELALL